MSGQNPRVNILVPLDMSIKIEKESDKRGIHRTQFIKEAIHEKLTRMEDNSFMEKFDKINKEIEEINKTIKELREIVLLVHKEK